MICRLSGLAAKFYGEVGIQAQATSKRVFLLCQRPEGATQPIPGGAPGGLWHVCLPGPHALPAGARGVRTWEQAASWRRSNTPATIRRRPAGGRAASAGNRRCAPGSPTAVGAGPGACPRRGPGGPAHWGEGRTPQTRSCPGRWRRDRAQTPSRCRGSAQCPPLSLRPDSRRAPEACGHRSEARGAFPWGLPEKTVEGARKKSFPLLSSFSHLAMSLAPLGWVTRLVMKDRPDGRFPPYASVYCD